MIINVSLSITPSGKYLVSDHFTIRNSNKLSQQKYLVSYRGFTFTSSVGMNIAAMIYEEVVPPQIAWREGGAARPFHLKSDLVGLVGYRRWKRMM